MGTLSVATGDPFFYFMYVPYNLPLLLLLPLNNVSYAQHIPAIKQKRAKEDKVGKREGRKDKKKKKGGGGRTDDSDNVNGA